MGLESVGSGRTPTGDLLMTIHNTLLAYYGPQTWWPTRTGSAWEVILGAILTQHTSWTNVELSLANVETIWGQAGLRDPQIIADAPLDAIMAAVRPSGFFTQKPQRLMTLARYVLAKGGLDALAASTEATQDMRRELLALNGVGPETADAILLYALNRPMFIADAYAVRLCSRWGLCLPTAKYAEVQALFMDNLPHDAGLYNEYHALIVMHGKALCKTRPNCEACPLNLPVAVGVESGNAWTCPKLYTVRKV